MMRARRLAAYVGMPIRFIESRMDIFPGYSWDGHELFIPPERSCEQIEHEICHYIECEGDPERRRVPEFGLGKAPYRDLDDEGAGLCTTLGNEKLQGGLYQREDAEVGTCLLQMWLTKYTRGPWRIVGAELSFFPSSYESFHHFFWRNSDHDYALFRVVESGALDVLRRFVRKERHG